MFRTMRRGFAILPAVVFVAILGVAAMGIETFAPQTNPQSQTASSYTEEATSNIFQSTAPKSCEEAIRRALGKSSDGPSTNLNDKGKTGTMDTCHGAVLLPRATSLTPDSYQCVGRWGVAILGNGRVTTRTEALRGSKDGQCTMFVCEGTLEAPENCKRAQLFEGGIQSLGQALGGNPSAISITSGSGEGPVPLDESQQQGFEDAFKEEAMRKELEVSIAREDLNNCVINNCSAGSFLQAKHALTMREQELAALNQQLEGLKNDQVFLGSPPPTLEQLEEVEVGYAPGGPRLERYADTSAWLENQTFGRPTCASHGYVITSLNPVIVIPCSQLADQDSGGMSPFWKGAIVGGIMGGLLGWMLGGSDSGSGGDECADPPCTPPGGSAPPRAEITCDPNVVDAGSQLTISYTCSSGKASSNAFTVTTQPSGLASLVVATPPPGFNTASYALLCTSQGRTAHAQCSIQVNRPFIIFVANPKTVPTSGTSVLGWLTGGMRSCVISSPDQDDFTLRNLANFGTSGVASTSPITTEARFVLRCDTFGGGVREATTTVSVQ